MKKSYLYILSFLLLAIAGCKNSDDGYLKQQLIGEWEDELYTITDQETSEELTYVESYRFYNNSEYIRVTTVHNLEGELVGYIRLIEGSFSVSDKDILFKESKFFRTDDNTYSETVDELKKQNEVIVDPKNQSIYRLLFNERFDELVLYPRCGPLDICEAPELTKLN